MVRVGGERCQSRGLGKHEISLTYSKHHLWYASNRAVTIGHQSMVSDLPEHAHLNRCHPFEFGLLHAPEHDAAVSLGVIAAVLDWGSAIGA